MKCVLHRQSEGVVDSEGGAEGYLVRLEEQWGVRKLSVEASYTLTARILDRGILNSSQGVSRSGSQGINTYTTGASVQNLSN